MGQVYAGCGLVLTAVLLSGCMEAGSGAVRMALQLIAAFKLHKDRMAPSLFLRVHWRPARRAGWRPRGSSMRCTRSVSRARPRQAPLGW